MKNILILFAILTLLLIGCKKNSPTNVDPQTNNNTDDVLDQETIGDSGGELTNGDFTMTVPGGAFSSTADIKLYQEQDNPLGDNAVSEYYRLEGMPSDFQTPLVIKIKVTGELVNTSFVKVSYEATVQDLDSTYTTTVSQLLEVSISNGYVLAELPPLNLTESLAKRATANDGIGTLEMYLGVVTNGAIWTTTGSHFNVKCDDVNLLNQYKNSILHYLEEAYDRLINSASFNADLQVWPMQVGIVKSKGLSNLYFSNSAQTLTIGNPVDFTFGRSIIHLFVLNYILESYNLKSDINLSIGFWLIFEYLPFDFAFTFYALDDEIHRTSEGFKLNGSTNNASEKSNAFILDYLLERYGENQLGKTALDMSFGINFIQSIINRMNSSEDWLADFHEYMLTSDKWKSRFETEGLTFNYWRNYVSAEINITSSTPEVRVTKEFHYLSGKLFKIVPGSDLQGKTDLTLSAESDVFQNADITVFSYKDGLLKKLGRASGAIVIEDLNAYADDGSTLYVLISNWYSTPPYTGKIDITLVASLKEEDVIEQPEIPNTPNFAHIAFQFSSTTQHTTYADGSQSDGSGPCIFLQSSDARKGEWNEDKTIFTWGDKLVTNTGTDIDTLTIVRTLDPNVIISFEYQSVKFDSTGFILDLRKIVASGIPCDETYPAQRYNEYIITGAGVCSTVREFEYQRNLITGFRSEITDYYCEDDAKFLIYFFLY